MRVLLTNTGAWGTGSATVAESILTELRHLGHEALLFFPDAQVETPDKESYYNRPDWYRIWKFPVDNGKCRLESFPLMIPDPNPRSAPGVKTFRDLSQPELEFYLEEAETELRRVIREFSPGIVDSMHIWALGWVLRNLGVPYFLTAHHSDQMGFRYDERMRPYAEEAARGAEGILAISDFVREEVLELYTGMDQRKVHVLPNGYNQRIFFRKRVGQGQLFHFFGIPERGNLPVISFTGKISRTKGVDILLRANRLIQKECKTMLIIAGTGSLEKEFSPEERQDFDLTNVYFVGHRPQVTIAQLHNVASVSVMPSRSEGFGLAGLEAMACGVPLVVTRSGGPETFAIGEIVSVEDVEELAAAILKVLNLSAYDRAEIGQEALQTAKTYSWEIQVKDRLEVYRSAGEG